MKQKSLRSPQRRKVAMINKKIIFASQSDKVRTPYSIGASDEKIRSVRSNQKSLNTLITNGGSRKSEARVGKLTNKQTMTTTSTHEKAEKIKKNINGFAEKSKETIRTLISQSTKQMENAIDANSKLFKETKEKLDIHGVENETIANSFKETFVKAVELAEDTFDGIINSYTRQMEHTVDYNTRLVEAVKEGKPKNSNRFLDLIHENFEATRELTVENTKEILDFYNKHTNLALNFNKLFSDNVKTQLDAMFQIQSKGLNRFTNWALDWWKEEPKSEKVS